MYLRTLMMFRTCLNKTTIEKDIVVFYLVRHDIEKHDVVFYLV